MTKQVIRKLIEEAMNVTAVEEALVEIIYKELDPQAVAWAIWDQWEDEIIAAAAEVADESILPF